MTKFLNSDGLSRLVALIKQALGGKQDTLSFDSYPTTASSNPVTSGGIKVALDSKQDVLEAVTTTEIDEMMSSTTDRNAFNYILGANLS